MQTLTADQFKQKYGGIAASQFNVAQKQQDQEASLFGEIKNAFTQGVGTIGQGINDATALPGKGAGDLVGGVGRILGGATQAITSPLAPVLNRTVSPAINAAGEALSNVPAIKDAYKPIGVVQPGGGTIYNQPDQSKAEGFVEGVSNYANAAGLVAGTAKGGVAIPKLASDISSRVSGAMDSIPKFPPGGVTSDITSTVKSGVRDVIPTKSDVVDSMLSSGLRLTRGDLANIRDSTGNSASRFLADNNLIGANRIATEGLVKDFFNTNYQTVRDEVGKVTKTYKPNQIPRYTDALLKLKDTVTGVLGKENEAVQIDNMLNLGRPINLSDVQAVKELLDKHYNLYNASGDVAQNTAKQGLATVRGELKQFIEQQVKDNTGAEIGPMNNNVSTSKAILDAIEQRNPPGLSPFHFSQRDMMIGAGLTFLNPLFGVPAMFLYKVATSPSIMLKFSRALDKWDDATKATISKQMSEGKLPQKMLDATGISQDELK